jgi:mRNA interferase RelE/StbE
MPWNIIYTDDAYIDLIQFEPSQRIQVLKAIRKVSGNPLPSPKGGYGKSLGNRLTSNLAGYFKVKLQQSHIRVVYRLVEERGMMRIIILSIREKERMNPLPQERIKKKNK